MTLIIDKSDALQLYCYLIYTHENRLRPKSSRPVPQSVYFDSFKNMHYSEEVFLKNAFKKFRKPKNTEDINGDICGRDKSQSKMFFNFSNKIRFAKHITISRREMDLYFKFLERYHKGLIDISILESLRESIRIKGNATSEWQISTKQYALANSKWWVYYWAHENKNPGIVRSLLALENFGKAIIYDYNTQKKLFEKYTGTFEIHSESHLRMVQKLDNDDTKDLRINFYIGSSANISFAVGQYNSIDGDIYTGTIIIEKIFDKALLERMNDESEMENIPKFIPFSKTTNEINSEIFDFLSKKGQNYMNVPEIIVDAKRLSLLEKVV